MRLSGGALYAPPDRAMNKAFRLFTLWTVFVTFALIVIGGIVRTTGSGLGCPDWPLCYGQPVPPYDIHSQIEFSHRLTTTLVSLSVVVLAGWATWRYRPARAIFAGAWLALVLLLVQIALGAIVVLFELPPALVGIHLANALLVFATLCFVGVQAHQPTRPALNRAPGDPSLRRLIVLSAALVFALIFSGSVVTNTNNGLACFTWPLCSDQLLPATLSQAVNSVHRYIAAAAGGLILYVLAQTLRRHGANRPLRRAAHAAIGLFGVQALVGGLNVFSRLQPAVNTLHLALATAVWGAMVVLATLAWYSLGDRPEPASIIDPGARPIEQSYSPSGD